MAVERFPVEAGHILMFARSVGDPNPIYADAEYAAGTEVGAIIAPPTFAQASAQFDPDYPLRPKFGRPWFGSGRNATGLAPRSGGESGGGGASSGGVGLHAEQHFEYHRPLRAGDMLSATTGPGERWEKQGRSGKLVFSENITEYRDQRGELVITARGVGVATEGPKASTEGSKASTKEDSVMAVSAQSLSVGDERELVLTDDLTRTQIVQYAGASGDYNPLHSDDKYARDVAGYPGVFAHGMLTMGMTGRLLTDWMGDGRLTRYGVRFVKQVWPGDALTAKATVDAVREEDGEWFADLSVVTVNQDGDAVVTGNATARLDP